MKAVGWKIKSLTDYCNGKVISRSGASWTKCRHTRTKRINKSWVSHRSIFEGLIFHRVISILKHGYTVWCMDCNKVVLTREGR